MHPSPDTEGRPGEPRQVHTSPEKQGVSSAGLRKAHTSLCDTFLGQGAEKRPIKPLTRKLQPAVQDEAWEQKHWQRFQGHVGRGLVPVKIC